MIDISNEHDFLSGAWHLAYYTPKYYPPDSLPRKMLNFKDWKQGSDKYKDDVIFWITWSTKEIMELNLKFDYIIRALGSSEVYVEKNKALDVLGQWLAKNLNSSYLPELLFKVKPTKPLNLISHKCDREVELKDSYRLSEKSQSMDMNYKNILIIDDITTSGTTLKEISDQLFGHWPNVNCYSFCLGRTWRNNNANDFIVVPNFK